MTTTLRSRLLVPCGWAALLAAACWLCYAPGIAPPSADGTGHQGIGFFLDDYQTIVRNQALRVESYDFESLAGIYAAGTDGPLKRPLSMLSFSLHYYFDKAEPRHFKIVNLCLHLLNGLLVAWLCSCLFRPRPRAGLTPALPDGAGRRLAVLWIAGLWLLFPVQISSVLYVVQRMNLLAALFSLLGMCLYCSGRAHEVRRGQVAGRRVTFGFLCVIPALLSKENGALLPLFLALLEGFFFRLQGPRTARLRLGVLYLLFLLLPACWVLYALFTWAPLLFEGYRHRDFTLAERLLTQARVMTHYLYAVLVPDLGSLFIFQDNHPVSKGLLAPPATLYSLLFTGALLGTAATAVKRFPVFSFGILYYFCGHLVESTILPLELSFDHRNYLPSLGLAMIPGYGMAKLYTTRGGYRKRRFHLGLLVLLLGAYGLTTRSLAYRWSLPMYEVSRFEAARAPHSTRANFYAAVAALRRYELEKAMVQGGSAVDREAYLEAALRYADRAVELAPAARIYPQVTRIRILQAAGLPIPRSLVEQLEHTLAEQRLHPRTSSNLAALLHCAPPPPPGDGDGGENPAPEDEFCGLEREQLEALLQAVIANRQLSPERRARYTRQYAAFLWNTQGARAALDLIDRARKRHPDSETLLLTRIEMRYAAGCRLQALREAQQHLQARYPRSAPRRLAALADNLEAEQPFSTPDQDDADAVATVRRLCPGRPVR